MKKFRVFIHGKNFASENADTGKVEKLGFYTTRFVKAKDATSAENLAINLIRKELKSFPLNDRSDPPMLYVEEIDELEAFGDHLVPGKGCTWYPEKQ